MPVYEHRRYEIAPGKMELTRLYVRDCSRPAFARNGFRLVGGPWEVIAGTTNTLTYVLEWDDLAARETAWAAFYADAEYQRVRAEIMVDGELALRAHVQFLRPVAEPQ